MTSATGTKLSTLVQSVTFARIENKLETLNIAIPASVKIYVVDPFETTLDLFKASFYAGSIPNTFTFFSPNDNSLSDENEARVKNLMFLSAGGGTFGSPPNQITLSKKMISFNTDPPIDLNISTYVIKDIAEKSGFRYTEWSVDSQIDLAKKLSKTSYFYDIAITTGPTTNVKALTYSELEKVVNTTLYNHYKSTNTPIVSGNSYPINLNFAVSFSSFIDNDNSSTTSPIECITQFIYQFRIDWPWTQP